MARPSKFTAITRNKIYLNIRRGMSERRSALVAGVSERTLRNWKEKGNKDKKSGVASDFSQFVVRLEQIEAIGEADMRKIIAQVAKGKMKQVEHRLTKKQVIRNGVVYDLQDEVTITKKAPPSWIAANRLLSMKDGDQEDSASVDGEAQWDNLSDEELAIMQDLYEKVFV